MSARVLDTEAKAILMGSGSSTTTGFGVTGTSVVSVCEEQPEIEAAVAMSISPKNCIVAL
ncbi:MAG: hypothetical protein IKD75_12045 [Prevotella sp.]|nr:hypothetical protein [Prevotella sp.]